MPHLKKNILELTHCTLSQYAGIRKIPLLLLADNVRSMHNIGAFFRTADAFRLEGIVLAGISGCPPHPEISKSALGAEDSVKWVYEKDAVEAVARLKKDGYRICVLEQTHGSIPLQDFEPLAGEKYLLVAGNEVDGVDQRIVDMADVVLEIEQCGVKHSLNVSVSTGIALWHLFTSLSRLENQGGE